MALLFNPQSAAEIVLRINRLTADAPAQWGKMNVAQMLAHCQKPIEVALGTLPLKRNFKAALLSALLGGLVKKQLLSGKAFKRNSPTVQEFIITSTVDFEREKKHLLEDLSDLVEKGINNDLADRHPFFGKMSADDWDVLHWRHLDHHLRQFGQ